MKPAMLRKMAATMRKAAEKKLAPRLTNTPKRQCEADSAAIDARRLRSAAEVMEVLADCVDRGEAFPHAERFTSKDSFARLVSKKIEHRNYYSMYETDEYHESEAWCREVRDFVLSKRSAAVAVAYAEASRKQLIVDMESRVRFLSIPGFFPTPEPVINMMLERILNRESKILEPSAGKGDIMDALVRNGYTDVHGIESNVTLCEILKAKGHKMIGDGAGDFEELSRFDHPQAKSFDYVLMNPPFERGEDAAHVILAYTYWLKPGGRLVAIVGGGSMSRQDKKGVAFREFLAMYGFWVEDIPEGSFKTAFNPTGVSCKMLTIDKR